MTSWLNYGVLSNQISNNAVISSADVNFVTMFPQMVSYAENRIYSEIDFLRTQVTDTKAVSSGVREFVVPTTTGYFITVDNINVITPVSGTVNNGSRVPLVPVSREFMDTVYPSGQTVTGVPEFYAMASDTDVLLGPSPDAAYLTEVIGEQRLPPLTAANSSTYLTQYVPDLFIAACMVFVTGYMQNFGAQSDNPQASQSWETQYKTLFAAIETEQLRAGFKSQGWTSASPNPVATPPRA